MKIEPSTAYLAIGVFAILGGLLLEDWKWSIIGLIFLHLSGVMGLESKINKLNKAPASEESGG